MVAPPNGPAVNAEDPNEENSHRGWSGALRNGLNFYRIHVIFFVFTPLVFSGIFYACNGPNHRISYVDSLFNCVSAMAVCGLVTVNLSGLTAGQQALLFIQMCIGNPIVISWLVVYQRRRYFAIEFKNFFEAQADRGAGEKIKEVGRYLSRHSSRLSAAIRQKGGTGVVAGSCSETQTQPKGSGESKRSHRSDSMRPVQADMIQRVDEEPRLVNPSGLAIPSEKDANARLSFALPPRTQEHHARPSSPRTNVDGYKRARRLSDPGSAPPFSNYSASRVLHAKSRAIGDARTVSLDLPITPPRGPSIEFASGLSRRHGRPFPGIPEDQSVDETRPDSLQHTDRRSTFEYRLSLNRQPSLHTHHTSQTHLSSQHSGFGFFPVITAIAWPVRRLFPNLGQKLTRTLTIPVTTPFVSKPAELPPGAKAAPYISFDTIVGRNSTFHDLSHEEMEELGGIEYRALTSLLWIIPGYHLVTQLAAFTVIAPYISTARWRDVFLPPTELRPVNTIWFSIFQVVSAYTNTGMSLVDPSMIFFEKAYPMLFFLSFLILAGNTAFPVFLRFTIWMLMKCTPKGSRYKETLHFLLDHPRRCYILLFPSHQTWFLFIVVFALTATDWFSFLVLDIGNPVVERIPIGTRFAVGLFQSTAVRSAGFAAVNIAALTAGVKVLYVVMMYISVYPIAMSIRSTNVYEEQSLGLFPETPVFDERDFESSGSRVTVWSRYLAMHARKQLAFDMWWLGLVLILLCIIEKHRLDDPSYAAWFNVFSIVFDLVSAYGGVGLSLGLPYDNYSFAGALKPLSKLILCLVMIRGRHRGLPMAIDRAVMLPSEFQRRLDQDGRSASDAFRPSTAHEQDSGSKSVSGNEM